MLTRITRAVFASVLALILASILTASDAFAARKLALVIGNAAYKTAPVLRNPANDAGDLATSLRRADFEVIEARDADRNAMAEAVRAFSGKLEGADLALFYYAGHGLQVNGDNYLVPIDAKIANAADVRFGTINLSDILGEMESGTRANIVILDACRDNPFADAIAHGGRSLGARGLSRVEKTGVGTLIVYSTQPNNVALDGQGRNSPFTEALLKHLDTPGVEVRQMISQVRADVLAATDRKQVPWDNSSLVGDVYLAAPPQVAAQVTPQATRSAAAAPDGADVVFWQTVAKADTKDMYDGYLKQFGESGQFSFLAHQRLDALAKKEPASTGAPQPERSLEADIEPTDCDRQMKQARIAADGNTYEGVVPVLVIEACKAAVAAHPADPRFEVLLGKAYETALNYVEANKHFQIAIARNDAIGMLRLGMNYQLGRGLLKNGGKAMDLYTRAVEAHENYAIFLLGTLYEQGIGVPKDYGKARAYFEKGAELGEINAVRALGVLYFDGWGVRQNYATALQYLEQAAVRNDKFAIKVIGMIYKTGGYGVRRDFAKARQWNAKLADTP